MISKKKPYQEFVAGMAGETAGMPEALDAQTGGQDSHAADREGLLALGAEATGLQPVDGQGLVEGNVVAGIGKVLELDAVLGLHETAVVRGVVLLGELITQLKFSIILAVRAGLGHFVSGDLTHPQGNSVFSEILRNENEIDK